MPIVNLQQFADHTATYVREADERTLVTRDGVPAIAVTPVKDPKRLKMKGRGAFALTMRELSRNTHKAVRRVEIEREVFVTYRGEVTAMIQKVDQDAFAALMLAKAPEFIESMQRADADFAAGRAKPLSEFIDSLED